jgi:hypothetical protein
MDDGSGGRIRVILRWIQILEGPSPELNDRGRFSFATRVLSPAGLLKGMQFPEEGEYDIADHPAWNKVVLNRTIYDGHVGEELAIEIEGSAIDSPELSKQLDRYRREFKGDPKTWVGWYGPGDDTSAWIIPDDPESMSTWRVCYVIEAP